MKTKISLLIILIGAILSSCNLEGESNFTPEVIFYKLPTNTTTNDTLNIYYTDIANVYRLDTIAVGDTVSFQMFMTGYYNNLTAFYITESSDSISKIILPSKSSMDSIFSSSSNYSTGKFFMSKTSTELYFPFKYIARKATNEGKITFTVVSDAKFEDSFVGSNTASFTLKTPIVVKQE